MGLPEIASHAHERHVGTSGNRGGMRRFFLKSHNPASIVDFNNAESERGFLDRVGNACDRQCGASFQMKPEHFGDIHFVNVVAAENRDMLGQGIPDQMQILKNRIGGALVPAKPGPHLRRDRVDIMAQHVERFHPRARCLLSESLMNWVSTLIW